MKKRILTGWTFQRWTFAAVGIFLMIQSIAERQWIGIPLGGYFAAMGIFAFGCASGNCSGNSCLNETSGTKDENIHLIK